MSYHYLLFIISVFFLNEKSATNCYGRNDCVNLDSIASPMINKALPFEDSVFSCQQIECKLWARINIAEQMMYLYSNQQLVYTFQVTTGNVKHKTPEMNRRPSGPMFVKYTSKKFPGGNYMGLGNMPYVVFIKGGYAIHGTTKGNIKLLGKKVSHGCIRLHPNNAKIFYELIEEVGIKNVWVTIVNE